MSKPTRIRRLFTSLAACCAVALPCLANFSLADSALPLLSGFDAERIQRVYPPQDDDSTGELAKLVYRLGSVDPRALESRVSDDANREPGDAVGVDGVIQEIDTLKVPSRLVEFLELTELQVVVVRAGESEIRVITTMLPREAKQGDRVSGVGVVVAVSESPQDANMNRPDAVASARLRWFPESTERTGWRLLSEAGVDVSLLADVGSRTRRPLLPQDGDAFYSMLAAASIVGQRDRAAAPSYVEPVTLLRDTEKLTGQWVRMDLETVQVTRISVTEPHRQAQLGSDHYYQIDAVGDLGNVIIQIERAAGDEGPAVTFENRYPVSVVSRELPEFLSQRIRIQEGGDAVVSQIKVLVGVDAFFYRLWSYSTVFMDQHGGGEQFGPLLIAATIRSQEPTSSDPAGVSLIGWIAAVAVLAAMIAIWFWNRRLSRRDQEIRDRRKMRESEELQLP